MSTESRRTSISTDWEELDTVDGIYDDTASILSLSTTLDASDSNLSDWAVSEHNATETQGLVIIPTSDRDLALAVTTPTLNDNDDADSIASAETIIGDLLDTVVEPPVLFSTLDSLQSTLGEIMPLCEDQNYAVTDVSKALHRLLSTIIDLKEVVSCYVRLWKPNDPFPKTPPLDPTLYKWCSNCALKLYKLQAELENPPTESKMDGLNMLCEDLGVFLPILRVDLDEYQTPELSFPNYPPSQEPSSHQSFLHRRYRNSDPVEVADGPIPALRRRLYALKDEIGKTNGIINDCKVTEVFSTYDKEKLSDIQGMQTCTFRALGILLSNHGSDWIDQTIAGGLTYAEFTTLDSLTIQGFEMRFSKFGNLLDDLRWSLSYNRSDGDTAVPEQGLTFSEQRHTELSSDDNAITCHVTACFDFDVHKATIVKLNSLLKVKVEEY